ncbi:cAMP-binding domain of CRP or a regulatory subunit of cAMP-dependent protein kinases [Methylobacterium sp. 174MFSha1.1]|uniref:Crp/Fnr family transcriptional regulator n=1 Tax=Methylobacterium sp. 174MFSha1.1 TaxID=1502749 RepID=UPI0008F3490E|nr:Crp/Fnr family transcriptional regulator [Methylobacterium sp. 174MFSha1.1]SFU82830.1 cAMP-binding domain of CRP or a regulatory subunit of cAMP-dependent protein kinases [Methylobacterium sp. 174MFSha1.1]
MSDSARYLLHRPEILESLRRGEAALDRVMEGSGRLYPAGRLLVEADSPNTAIFRLRKGWVGRLRTLEDGRSQFILIFLPGDLFAVKSLFVTHSPDAVQALSEVLVEQVDHRILREAYERDSDLATRCMWQVIEEERRLHNWVVGLGRGSADERLAMLLVELRGRLIRSGALPPDATAYDLPMTQEQIGDHLGISNVHVNRVLRAFREDGIVTMRGRRVTIGDLDALVRIAAPLLDLSERGRPEFVGGREPEAGDAGRGGTDAGR